MALYSFPSQLAATSVFFSQVPHKVFCWLCLSQGLYRFSALYPNGPCEHGHPKWIENSVRKPAFFIITGFLSDSLLDLEKHSCVLWFTCQGWSTYYFIRSLFCFWDVKRSQHRCQSYLRLIVLNIWELGSLSNDFGLHLEKSQIHLFIFSTDWGGRDEFYKMCQWNWELADKGNWLPWAAGIKDQPLKSKK